MMYVCNFVDEEGKKMDGKRGTSFMFTKFQYPAVYSPL